jgi:hypothetical protein
MKMKNFSIAVMTLFFAMECLAQNAVEEFYSLLISNRPITKKMESDLLSGDEEFMKFIIQKIPKYKNSETPVLEYLRDNKQLFLPKDERQNKNILISCKILFKGIGCNNEFKKNPCYIVEFAESYSAMTKILFSVDEFNKIEVSEIEFMAPNPYKLLEFIEKEMGPNFPTSLPNLPSGLK